MYVLIFYKISKKETIRISLLLSLTHLLQDYCSYFRKLDNLKVFSILNEDNLQDHIGENCSKVPDIGIARSCLIEQSTWRPFSQTWTSVKTRCWNKIVDSSAYLLYFFVSVY